MTTTAGEIAGIVARPYARVLDRGEDGMYTAYIAEFPGCISEGATPNEAISNLDEALGGIVRSMLESGDEIPIPLSSRDYSGRIMLRVPPALHARAALVAALQNVSLNRLLSDAVAEHVGSMSARRRESRAELAGVLRFLQQQGRADAEPAAVDLMAAIEAASLNTSVRAGTPGTA